MATDYCPTLQRLMENGYVDGELVYLQKLAVDLTMDPDLRSCTYCMKCGSPLGNHDDTKCLVVRNMTLLGKLLRREDQYLFNLELMAIKRDRNQGDPNYPEPFRMYHCPYCGGRYEFDLNRTNNGP
ncbi:MAG: hypothetical protein WBV84_03510 [Nitrososphaeraceae archaeon]